MAGRIFAFIWIITYWLGLNPLLNAEEFFDEKSGIHLQLPPYYSLDREESDIDLEEATDEVRWMVFSDGSRHDIELVITQLEKPLRMEEYFIQQLQKEFDEELSDSNYILFGVPSFHIFNLQGYAIAKIQYPVVSLNFDYLQTDYFFTHGSYGFNLSVSSEKNSKKNLVSLEHQIEEMLSNLQFLDSCSVSSN